MVSGKYDNPGCDLGGGGKGGRGGRGILISKLWGCFFSCLGVQFADFGLTSKGIQEENSIFLPIP